MPTLRGLIILPPWIDQIVAGRKVWELRPGKINIRGTIALIRAGSGMIVATARLADCVGPMSLAELRRHDRKHRVPPTELRRWLRQWGKPEAYAWVLSDVRPLPRPVPYPRKNGQQTWVKLPTRAARGRRGRHPRDHRPRRGVTAPCVRRKSE